MKRITEFAGGPGCLTFKRMGFLQTRATVRVCGGTDDVGTFNNGLWTSGGILVLPDGRRYWADTNCGAPAS